MEQQKQTLYNLSQIINRNAQRIMKPRNAACSSLVEDSQIDMNSSIKLNQIRRSSLNTIQPIEQKRSSLPRIVKQERSKTLEDKAIAESERIIRQCSLAIKETYPKHRIKFKIEQNKDNLSILRAEYMHQYLKSLIFESVDENQMYKNKNAINYVKDDLIQFNKTRILSQYKRKQLKELIRKQKQNRSNDF